jgi:hypothetical protein
MAHVFYLSARHWFVTCPGLGSPFFTGPFFTSVRPGGKKIRSLFTGLFLSPGELARKRTAYRAYYLAQGLPVLPQAG